MGRDAAAPILFAVFDQLPVRLLPPAPPPAGAILAATADLPEALRRFGPDLTPFGLPQANGGKDALSIAFPVDGSTVELPKASAGLKSLPLDASGGALPLTWLVNGRRVDSAPFRREAEWLPDGPGAARVTVIDRAGHAASSEVWLQ